MSNVCYRRSILDGGRLRQSVEPMQTPKRGQVLVRLKAASINYRDGLIGAGNNFRGPVPENLIPLSDAAGVIEEVGPEVNAWQPGDRVASTFMPRWTAGEISQSKAAVVTGTTVDGVLTHWRIFEEDEIVRIPTHLSWQEAATLPCAALTAWSALNGPVPVRAGESVVVLGTGGVALFAVQFASAMGARVILTSSSDAKLQRGASLGVTDTINYVTTPHWHERVRELTGREGADHVVETNGPGTFEQSMAACRMGGQVYAIGTQSNGAKVDGAAVLRARVTLRSVTVGSHEAFAQMNLCLSHNRALRPVIDRVFPFEQAESALDYLKSGSHFGKVVLDID